MSNETQNWDVFFDNLSVQHRPGAILEENHYYPYGLTMAGISDKAVKSNYSENKYRFGGKELQHNEFSDGTGLELYDFNSRNYDPQIGRWGSDDPNADKAPFLTPYRYGFDNPVRFFDPDGKYEEDGHYWTVYLLATQLKLGNARNLLQLQNGPMLQQFLPI